MLFVGTRKNSGDYLPTGIGHMPILIQGQNANIVVLPDGIIAMGTVLANATLVMFAVPGRVSHRVVRRFAQNVKRVLPDLVSITLMEVIVAGFAGHAVTAVVLILGMELTLRMSARQSRA